MSLPYPTRILQPLTHLLFSPVVCAQAQQGTTYHGERDITARDVELVTSRESSWFAILCPFCPLGATRRQSQQDGYAWRVGFTHVRYARSHVALMHGDQQGPEVLHFGLVNGKRFPDADITIPRQRLGQMVGATVSHYKK